MNTMWKKELSSGGAVVVVVVEAPPNPELSR